MKIKQITKYVLTCAILLLLLLTNPVSQTDAATLGLSASASTVLVNSVVSVNLFVSSTDKYVNSYTATVNYDSSYLQAYSATSAGSICSIFIQNPTLGTTSTTVTCGQPNPGFKSSYGKLMTIYFKPIKQGTTTLSIGNGARVLANDGNGTDVLASKSGVTIQIIKPEGEIKVPSISANVGKSGNWINSDYVTFSWNLPDKATGFRYVLSKDPNATPTTYLPGSTLSKVFKDIEDGIYYFKVIATDGLINSPEANYVLMVDTTPPTNTSLLVDPCASYLPSALASPGTTSNKCKIYTESDDVIDIDTAPLIGFSATDEMSGIAKYEVSIDGRDFFPTGSPYQFTEIVTGMHIVKIRAYDIAGNYSEQEIIFNVANVEPPVLTDPPNGTVINNSNGFIVSGTALRNSNILFYLNGTFIGSTFSDSQGNFEFFMNSNLPPGEYDLSARTKTDGGVISDESSLLTFEIQSLLSPVSSLSEITYQLVGGGCCCLLFLLILLLLLLKRRRKDEDDEILEAPAKEVVDLEATDVDTSKNNLAVTDKAKREFSDEDNRIR